MLRAVTLYCKYLVKAYCVTLITTRDAGEKRRALRSDTPTSLNPSRKVLLTKDCTQHTLFTAVRSVVQTSALISRRKQRVFKKRPSLLGPVLRNLHNCDRMQ
jgi:hypothetical protein